MRGGLSEKVVSPSESRPPATLAELSCQRRSFERLRLTGGDFCGGGVGFARTCLQNQRLLDGLTLGGRWAGRRRPVSRQSSIGPTLQRLQPPWACRSQVSH